MKKLVVFGVVVVAAVFFVKLFKQTDMKAFETNTQTRVEKMFKNLESGNTADAQEAMGLWRVGHPELASEDIENAFLAFLAEKDLRRVKVKSYALVSTELIDGEDTVNRHIILACKVNGKKLKLKVRHKLPLEWVD